MVYRKRGHPYHYHYAYPMLHTQDFAYTIKANYFLLWYVSHNYQLEAGRLLIHIDAPIHTIVIPTPNAGEFFRVLSWQIVIRIP